MTQSHIICTIAQMALQRQHSFSSDVTLKQVMNGIGYVGPGHFQVDARMQAIVSNQASQNT